MIRSIFLLLTATWACQYMPTEREGTYAEAEAFCKKWGGELAKVHEKMAALELIRTYWIVKEGESCGSFDFEAASYTIQPCSQK